MSDLIGVTFQLVLLIDNCELIHTGSKACSLCDCEFGSQLGCCRHIAPERSALSGLAQFGNQLFLGSQLLKLLRYSTVQSRAIAFEFW